MDVKSSIYSKSKPPYTNKIIAKKILLICIILRLFILSNKAFSKNDSVKTASNLLYIEVGGAGGYGSVNYERVLFIKKHLNLAMSIGLSTYHFKDYKNEFNPDIIIPFSIKGYYGKNHKIELGIGQTYTNIVYADYQDFKPARETEYHTFLSIGYRYNKPSGGILFRCAYTPLIEFNYYFRHWAAISLGYSF